MFREELKSKTIANDKKKFFPKVYLILIGICMICIMGGCSSQYKINGEELADYVTLGSYLNYRESAEVNVEVTDEEVEEKINEILESNANSREKKNASLENGDLANITFSGTLNGKEVEGASAESYNLIVGKNTFVSGFEDNLVGMNTGETKEFEVTYPEKFESNTSLEGKKVKYQVTLNKIKKIIVPNLTEDFVKKVSNYNTIDEFKKDIKRQLEEKKYQEKKEELEEEVWKKVLADCTVKEYPKEYVNTSLEEVKKYYTEAASAYGMDLEKFCKDYLDGMTEEEMRDIAKEIVFEKMVVHAIAKEENITVSDKELEERSKELTEKYSYKSTDDFIKGNGGSNIKESILVEKIKKFVAGMEE